MTRALRLTVFVPFVALSMTVTLASADLWDTARKSVKVDTYDTSGYSMRGGANLSTGTNPSSTTLFRGTGSVHGGCGAFDFETSIKEAFAQVPQLFEAAGQALLSNMPLLVLCWSEPTLCDLWKDAKNLINSVISARFAQCHQTQALAEYAGLRLRGGETSRCLEEQAGRGVTISEALRTCNSDPSDLRAPDGSRRVEVNLVKDTLAAAGASTETQTLARGLLGEVTLRAGQGYNVDYSHPQAALMSRYESHKADADAALRQAVTELQQTGAVSPQTLQDASVPGQSLPRAALDALVTLQADPVRYEALLGKLSTGMALTRLTWDCSELQETLMAASQGNAHLSDEERRVLEQKYQSVQRALAQLMAKTEVLEKSYQPAVDALLREYTATQEQAMRLGLTAPTLTTPPMPFRGAGPAGYGR